MEKYRNPCTRSATRNANKNFCETIVYSFFCGSLGHIKVHRKPAFCEALFDLQQLYTILLAELRNSSQNVYALKSRLIAEGSLQLVQNTMSLFRGHEEPSCFKGKGIQRPYFPCLAYAHLIQCTVNDQRNMRQNKFQLLFISSY